jgi:hypothetical protein
VPSGEAEHPDARRVIEPYAVVHTLGERLELRQQAVEGLTGIEVTSTPQVQVDVFSVAARQDLGVEACGRRSCQDGLPVQRRRHSPDITHDPQ